MYTIEFLQQQDLSTLVDLACEFKLESQTVSPLFDKLHTDYKNILHQQLSYYVQKEDCKILVAKHEHTMVGFIVGYIWEYLPIYEIRHIGYIPELFVSSAYRSQGIASALISKMEEWFRQKQVKFSRIETIHFYSQNKTFYENRGYNLFLYEMRKIL